MLKNYIFLYIFPAAQPSSVDLLSLLSHCRNLSHRLFFFLFVSFLSFSSCLSPNLFFLFVFPLSFILSYFLYFYLSLYHDLHVLCIFYCRKKTVSAGLRKTVLINTYSIVQYTVLKYCSSGFGYNMNLKTRQSVF